MKQFRSLGRRSWEENKIAQEMKQGRRSREESSR